MRRVVTAAALALLALAIPFDVAKPMLPFAQPLGLDFHNLYAFHHCALRNAPYSRDDGGVVCGDAEGRAMKYPPLLYWLFAWTRPLPYGAALAIWMAFIVAASWLALRRWLPPRPDPLLLLFAALLFVQFPMFFALERGNSDVLVLMLWTAAFAAFTRRRDTAAGVFAGLAIATKVYPLVAAAVVAVALLHDPRRAARFILGCAGAAAAALLLFARETLQYAHILRAFAAERPAPSVFSHGIPSFYGPAAAAMLIALLLGAWAVRGWRSIETEPDVVFAGALAISTFVAATSFDYNLITAFPLLAVLFRRRSIATIPLLLTITVPRALFPPEHAALQVAALVVAAVTARATER